MRNNHSRPPVIDSRDIFSLSFCFFSLLKILEISVFSAGRCFLDSLWWRPVLGEVLRCLISLFVCDDGFLLFRPLAPIHWFSSIAFLRRCFLRWLFMFYRHLHISRLVAIIFYLFLYSLLPFSQVCDFSVCQPLNLPIPRPRAVSLPMRVLLSDFTGRSTSKNSLFSLIPGSGKQARTELVVRESWLAQRRTGG